MRAAHTALQTSRESCRVFQKHCGDINLHLAALLLVRSQVPLGMRKTVFWLPGALQIGAVLPLHQALRLCPALPMCQDALDTVVTGLEYIFDFFKQGFCVRMCSCACVVMMSGSRNRSRSITPTIAHGACTGMHIHAREQH